MGREIRRVPPTWVHPLGVNGRPIPLRYGAGGRYEACAAEWDKECALWAAGVHPDHDPKYRHFSEWDGERPRGEDYMLVGVSDETCTHLQLYETTSEGTPIGPVFADIEALCAWAEDGATTFASFKTSAAEWRRMLEKGHVYHEEIAANGARFMWG